MNIKKIRKKMLEESDMIFLKDQSLREEIITQCKYLSSKKVLTLEEMEDAENLLFVLLNYYTYSEEGDILVPDSLYDALMSNYMTNGGTHIFKADSISNKNTQWDFVKHEMPGMVGTIKKIYDVDELAVYMHSYRKEKESRKWTISPKYDGVSSAIKVSRDGDILLAVTRYTGYEGQNITKTVRNASNIKSLVKGLKEFVFDKTDKDYFWIKTEIVVDEAHFRELNNEKPYKNRRSATTGIINTPKNTELGKYLTIIPLATVIGDGDNAELITLAPMSKVVETQYVNVLYDEIEKLFEWIKASHFPIRTDGVIITPMGRDFNVNMSDVMNHSIAYKVNTSFAYTHIKYPYVSVGRLGNAIPMLKVEPVELNETTVEDISVGSFDKFFGFDLREGEMVKVFSAGDVIPQVSVESDRDIPLGARRLRLDLVCPYCNHELTKYMNSYRCTNQDCPRLQSGKIANFIVKLGVDGISDKTIEDLVDAGYIKSIPDLFNLNHSDLAKMDGYGPASASIIINSMNELKNRKIPVSLFLGSLGIQGISEKKCRKILNAVPFDKLYTMKPSKLKFELLDGECVGHKTADVFVDFISDNSELIEKLVRIMNITSDVKYKGDVVFTGFRNPDLEKKFNDLGYEVSSSVTDKTIAVINASYDDTSSKCIRAKKKGIDVVHLSDVDEVLIALKRK